MRTALLLSMGLLAPLTLPACPRNSPAEEAPPAVKVPKPTPPRAPELEAKLVARWGAMPKDYVARTKHKDEAGKPQFTNRLFLETSPYLLQHAHNPVNWFPWGDEAFARAKALGRPVFLSVGYSTCHWCHVMEEESFEDLEIAQYMNDNYVAIKVDREERPDVDAIYMSAVRILTSGGGWPMSVWLTPERTPYMGGTYFPPRDGARGSRAGFLTILKKLKGDFDDDPATVATRATELAARVKAELTPSGRPAGSLNMSAILDETARFFAATYDEAEGGLRRRRKFPSSLPIRVLLREHRRTGNAHALAMAEHSLQKMADGGLHDQVGGGFHRYTVDPMWRVPHFEKMLYDNALLTVAYLEAHQLTGNPAYAQIARRTLDYVKREMTSPEGGFYSATDADSPVAVGSEHREEGLFFTWTPAEIDALLNAKDAALIKRHFDITPAGNFEGRSVLRVAVPLQNDGERARVAAAIKVLYEAREKRARPLRDDKILVSWNGLMISAFAMSHRITGDAGDLETAAAAAEFILEKMRTGGKLRRTYLAKQTSKVAFLDDYAFLIAGLLDLFEASGETRWLNEAIALDAVLARDFEDPAGGYFLTPNDHETLIVREKPSSDGAVPSGNSVQARNLLRLHALTTTDDYRIRTERLFATFGKLLSDRAAVLSEMLLAVDLQLERTRQVVLVGGEGRAPMRAVLQKVFLPNAVTLDLEAARKDLKLADGKIAQDGKTTAYVCEDTVCQMPITEPEKLRAQLSRLRYP